MRPYVPRQLEMMEIEAPILPERSALYSLEPVGIGTPDVESLTSYINRLAGEHLVTIGALLTGIVLHKFNKAYLLGPTQSNMSQFWKTASALNGANASARDLAQLLERLTQQRNLIALTMSPWSDVLPVKGLIRLTKAWCAYCYAERKHRKQVVYDPLCWSLAVVTVCTRHRAPLEIRCRQCTRFLPVLTYRAQPGYCGKCGYWLGSTSTGAKDGVQGPASRTSKGTGEEQSDWDYWVAEVIGELLQSLPAVQKELQWQIVSPRVSGYIASIPKNSTAQLARELGYCAKTVKYWEEGKQQLQLGAVLKLSHYLGITPLRLMTQEPGVRNSTVRGLPDWMAEAGRPQQRPRSRSYYDREVKQLLQGELDTGREPPPSMCTVAKRLGYDQGYLTKLFPDLCQQISKRYADYRTMKKRLREDNLRQEVRGIALRLHAAQEYPSLNLVRAQLRNPNVMRDAVSKKEWREVLQELGYTVAIA